MGLEDRDYMSEERPGTQLTLPETFVMRILLFTCGVYLAQVFFPPVTDALKLSFDWWERPWNVYRLLTYGFLHDPHGIMHLGWNMFALWMFGSSLAMAWFTSAAPCSYTNIAP